MTTIPEIKAEILKRLRATGIPVGTKSNPDAIDFIDGVYVKIDIKQVKRWNRVGYEVSWSVFDDFKTDYHCNLDYDPIIPALLSYVDRKKEEIQKAATVEARRQQIADIVKSCGAEMCTPVFCTIGPVQLWIEGENQQIVIKLPFRRRKLLRGMLLSLIGSLGRSDANKCV
jgi:hypothetical protein